jgi:hypothetical protein
MISCTLHGEEEECLTFQLVIHADLSWAEENRRSTSIPIGIYIYLDDTHPFKPVNIISIHKIKKPSGPASCTGSGPTGKGSVATPQEK